MIADPKTLPPTRQPLAGYKVGYIGFTSGRGLIADGICYFERWSRLSDISVYRAFVVTGLKEGVRLSSLSKYFDDPKTACVFRRPKGYTEGLGNRIAATACQRIGSKYNIGLIAAQLMA